MKELHLCPKIIAQIEAQLDRRVDFNEFPKSQQVTYRYFVGRVAVYRFEFGRVLFFVDKTFWTSLLSV